MRRAASLWHPAARLRLAVCQAARRTVRKAGFSSHSLAPSAKSLERSAKGSGKRRPRPSRAMHVVSVNVGQPRRVRWKGRDVTTGIFKEPVEGTSRCVASISTATARPISPSTAAPDKAVYAYPAEHYRFWQAAVPAESCRSAPSARTSRSRGCRSSAKVHSATASAVGTAELVVTQPRVPCYKLGPRFGRDDMPERFLPSGRTASTSPSRSRAMWQPATASSCERGTGRGSR